MHPRGRRCAGPSAGSCAAILLAAWVGWLPAARAAVARSAQVERGESRPVIDGRLDEAVWQRATRLDGFIQVLPIEGAAPSEQTEIRVFYDSEFLYFGVRCYDREPEKLIAKQMTQDTNMTGDDRINLILDTFHDQRNAFFFQINPVGTRSEALIENNETFRREWDGIWYGEARIDDAGWTAEIAIPFKTVSFAPGQTSWGFEAERFVRRRNENSRWANPSRNRTVLDVAGIGTLHGLEEIEGTGLDVKPRYSASWQRDHAANDEDRLGSGGLDLFYKFTAATTLGLTLNPDFSDAPVDDRQVNLTRFSLFFPETRDFFLQDSGIFQFGGLTEDGLPFFSRRIGLVEGEILDLDAGIKATGRIGDLNFGALHVRTGSGHGVGATSLSVGRVQLNVLEESQLGFIATRGDPADRIENALVGMDFRYRNSRLGGDRILRGDFWLQRSFSSGQDGREAAFGAGFEYPNDRIHWALGVTEFQENFAPALGRVSRTGVRVLAGSFRRRWRPEGSYLRTIDTGIEGEIFTDRKHHLETAEIRLNLVELANHAGDRLRLRYIFTDDRPTGPFVLADDTVVAVDDYRYDRYSLRWLTTISRVWSGELEFIWGGFLDGRLQETIGKLEYRPSPRLFASLEYVQNDARLPGRAPLPASEQAATGRVRSKGDFTQRLVRLRLNIGFTPELSWTTLVQYDNASDSIGINSRLRWEIESGREFFLVWNQAYDVDETQIQPSSTDFTARLGWTFRF